MRGPHVTRMEPSQPSQVHFPATLRAAGGIPGDNQSGMNRKQTPFVSGSTQGARCTPKSLRQLKCQVPQGR